MNAKHVILVVVTVMVMDKYLNNMLPEGNPLTGSTILIVRNKDRLKPLYQP